MIKSHHFSAILPVSERVANWKAADFILVLKNAAKEAELFVVGELAFAFQPHGVSAVILLAESHVALHFWTEEAKVTIDIHICDYQKDNLEKARAFVKLLTTQFVDSERIADWKYLYITG